jgi:hypothetical protein
MSIGFADRSQLALYDYKIFSILSLATLRTSFGAGSRIQKRHGPLSRREPQMTIDTPDRGEGRAAIFFDSSPDDFTSLSLLPPHRGPQRWCKAIATPIPVSSRRCLPSEGVRRPGVGGRWSRETCWDTTSDFPWFRLPYSTAPLPLCA